MAMARFVMAALLFGTFAAAARADSPVPEVPENVKQLMQDRKYAEAIRAIDAAAKLKDAPVDYLNYLKGRAHHLQDQYDEAIAVYDGLAKNHPQSPWVRRARFAKGVSLARKGDFRGAELIYRAEAQYLLSADRKQEIADVYVEFADAFFKPAKDDESPDYAKALEFYREALEVGAKPESRVVVELRVAQCAKKLGNHGEAIQLLGKFIKDHAGHALEIEARYLMGESHLEAGDRENARRAWQDLLALHKDSDSERLAEAAYNISLTHGVPAPDSEDQLNLGVGALRSFVERYPRHKLASEAHLRIAQSYAHFGRFEEAVATLEKFLADPNYAAREEIPEARNLLGQAFLVQKKFDAAMAAWREYLARHPAHSAWSDVQRAIIATEHLAAAEKRAQKEYDAARKMWGEFLVKYPLDERSPEILFTFGHMNFEQEKWDEAVADWRRVVSKYPDTDAASRSQYMIAVTMEEKLGKLDEALKEFEKVASGNFAGKARQRVARLTAKNMFLATDRVYRSDETPCITLTSRNIESVRVRVYAVDMETYFRKMHLARGVESLDIALIDPDRTFEFKVPDYKDYQETVSRIEVPLPQKGEAGAAPSGVLAVTVSSTTLEATTLVLQSDLDIIVHSSRDEVLVFAENMRTGKPWPEARILVSDGQEIFAEGKTGADGVYHQALEQLKSAGDVRVFAVGGGSVASNSINLNGLRMAVGLSPKGYVYTERPAYRAGQLVNVRGVIRQVAGDAYVVAQGKKYSLHVYDNRNRPLHEGQVTLGEFGSFRDSFTLPPGSPQGDYRVLVRDEEDKESYQGTFIVHEYQLEPVQLEIRSERSTFLRGEMIEGTIQAAYYYGAPLAGREIRYGFAGGRVETATTDDKGEVRFSLPTREFRESQPISLIAVLPERNLQIGKAFFVAMSSFSLQTSTVRPLFLAGETFEVTAKAQDLEGKPIAQAVTLSVVERTLVNGRAGEVLVAKHELTTDEKEGTARHTLRLEKGGNYVLRVEGIDRFQNPVTAAAFVAVSDDKDSVRLRILADRHTYKVGDTATVQLHWRQEPALALVTYQGARILEYRLVQLQKGANALEIPMTAKLAPNFELAVAVMTDPRDGKPAEGAAAGAPHASPRRFHSATSPFAVQRDLRVAVEVARPADPQAAIRPGDKIEVRVTTTDPQGKPIAAEVSLAMIEQALLSRFDSPLPAMGDFFRGQPRATSVRTTSSATFAYRPTTRPIDPRLLSETERLAMAKEEEKRLIALRESLARRERDAAAELIAGADAPANDPRSGEVREGRFEDLARVETWGGGLPNGQPGTDETPFGLDPIEGSLPPEVARQLGALSLVPNDGGFYFAQPDGGQGQSMRQGQGQGQQSLQFEDKHQLELANSGDGWHGRISGLARNDAVNMPNAQEDAEKLTMSGRRGTPFDRNGNLDFVYKLGKDVPLVHSLPFLNRLFDHDRNEILVVQKDGSMWNLNLADELGGKWDAQRAEVLVARLNDAGALLLPARAAHETAFWSPAVVTDAEGKATVEITLPDRSTAWRLVAKGITLDTLAGEGESELVAAKELFGQLKLPAAFTDGDDAQVIASVHNDALDKGTIEVTLKTTIGGKSTSETKAVEFARKGIQEVAFTARIALPNDAPKAGQPEVDAQFELTVRAGQRVDVARRNVPVQPFGIPVYAIAGGAAVSDATAFVDPPKGMPLASPQMQVLLGPTVERSLLDVVLAPPTWCQLDAGRIASDTDTAVSDLLAALALQKLLVATRDAGSPQAESLDARIRSSLAVLIASQRDDGGWSWAGASGPSNRYTTARAVWGLSLARAAGYRIAEDAFQQAVANLQTELTKTGVADYETKAVLLHGLAAAGSGDFPLANQLYRNRQALSAGGLAYLALALAEMDRVPTAGEILTIAAERNLDDGATKRKSEHGALPWTHAPSEVRALYALALARVNPGDPRLGEQVDWLLAHRTGHRWSPDKATGPAMLVLGDWFARTKFQGEKYKLTIFVNDLKFTELEIDNDSRTQTLDVPANLLGKDRQRVRFEITGRGRFTYQCVLGGFVPADQLKSTTQDWTVTRTYEPAALEIDGRPLPRGFDVLAGAYTRFRNDLSQLPVASRGQVELRVTRQDVPGGTPAEQLEYLVVTEPLPAGATVVAGSVKGGFERFELSPGAITFYVGSRLSIAPIEYEIHGYLPGAYRAGPTVVRDAFRADQIAVAETKKLAVLPLGTPSGDQYRLSPRELFELGRHDFEAGRYDRAARHLGELVKNWNLQAAFHKQVAVMLLDVHLKNGPPGEVVRYFEIVMEKYPDVEVSFPKFLEIGDAYHKLGEYERSYLVFLNTVEASFLRESRVAGFLEAREEFLRSVDVMSRLLREYPPESYVAAATYALAQGVYAKAGEAATDPKLREKNVTRVDLMRQTLARLDDFLAQFPEDPAADQASFSLASALLELELYPQAIASCQRYAERYPKSDYVDSYWYVIGFCEYALGRHQAALDMCAKVAEAQRVDQRTGRAVESPNKWRAIYILGQIYHTQGKPEEAIGQYERVKDRFVDARQAIDFFARKEIAVPEVSTFKPGEAITVNLTFRNVPDCDVRVYRIDLMKFSLLRRNLADITKINLAGIRPYHEVQVKLGEGKDFRDRKHALELPVKEEGAYLLVCRGENLYASGLVVVSPLALEVQEEATSGRVRTTVRDLVKDQYVPDAHVKVIGTYNSDFTSGESDLRGIFVADGIRGRTTVVAQVDGGRYAFFRGTAEIGPPPQPAQQSPARPSAGEASNSSGKAEQTKQLLEEVFDNNKRFQQDQRKQLDDLYNNSFQKGFGGNFFNQ